MIRYTLRQLEYFVAAADARSVARAAELLNVSQPSVSTAIGKLEEQMGVQLFIRHHGQGISLTPGGRRLVRDARNLLHHGDELQSRARLEGSGISGHLDIASFITLAPMFLPALVADFAARHKGVEIGLTDGTQDVLLGGLRRGRFDQALLYDVDLPDDISAVHLLSQEPYVLVARGHRLAKAKTIALEDLACEPAIQLDVPPSRAYFSGLLQAHEIVPEVAYRTSSLELVRGLVARGLGYALLITRPAGDVSYEGRALVARPLAGKHESGRIVLARLRQIRPTRLMLAFEAFCVEYFLNQQGGNPGAP